MEAEICFLHFYSLHLEHYLVSHLNHLQYPSYSVWNQRVCVTIGRILYLSFYYQLPTQQYSAKAWSLNPNSKYDCILEMSLSHLLVNGIRKLQKKKI